MHSTVNSISEPEIFETLQQGFEFFTFLIGGKRCRVAQFTFPRIVSGLCYYVSSGSQMELPYPRH